MSKPKFVKFNDVNINATHYKGKNLKDFTKDFKTDHKEAIKDGSMPEFNDDEFKEIHDIINEKPKKEALPAAPGQPE